jgi:hypothetical protein
MMMLCVASVPVNYTCLSPELQSTYHTLAAAVKTLPTSSQQASFTPRRRRIQVISPLAAAQPLPLLLLLLLLLLLVISPGLPWMPPAVSSAPSRTVLVS